MNGKRRHLLGSISQKPVNIERPPAGSRRGKENFEDGSRQYKGQG